MALDQCAADMLADDNERRAFLVVRRATPWGMDEVADLAKAIDAEVYQHFTEPCVIMVDEEYSEKLLTMLFRLGQYKTEILVGVDNPRLPFKPD